MRCFFKYNITFELIQDIICIILFSDESFIFEIKFSFLFSDISSEFIFLKEISTFSNIGFFDESPKKSSGKKFFKLF